MAYYDMATIIAVKYHIVQAPGRKWLTVTNALAYCNTELIMVVKSFILQAT